MKKVSIAVIGGAAMTIASLAQAADLPRRYDAPSAAYDPSPVYSWNGLYVGGSAGVGFGGFGGVGTADFGRSPMGGVFGLTAGYNYQSGKLVVGVEGDYAFSHISDSAVPAAGAVSSGVVQNLSTVRARFGYAADRLLIYATGGYAGGNVRGNYSSVPFVGEESHYSNGWALGLGMEYAITPHFSLKAEYLYAGLGSNTFFGANPLYMTSASANISQLRAGVNYHF
jgi:outer membrane immunogenic protein